MRLGRYQLIWWGLDRWLWKPCSGVPTVLRGTYLWMFRWLCFEVRKLRHPPF